MDYATTHLAQGSVRGARDLAARVEQRLSSAPFLGEPLRRLGYNCDSKWAWANYRATVLALAQTCLKSGRHHEGRVRVLEIGGGREPLLTIEEAQANNIELTLNDIDERELARAPALFKKAKFDVAGDIDPTWEGQFDLIISRMVFEHVRNAPRAWTNKRNLLAPGGVVIAFHPTLYAPPFVMNILLPESLTSQSPALFLPRSQRRGTTEISRVLRNVLRRSGQGRAYSDQMRFFSDPHRSVLASRLFRQDTAVSRGRPLRPEFG